MQLKQQKAQYELEQRSKGAFYMKLFGTQPQQQVMQKQTNIILKDIPGLYIYGDPGCGKTFIMDMFYENLQIKQKNRVHFNEYMLSIHKMMHKAKEEQKEDPIISVAMQQSFEQRLLCLDEFQVTDIADALILKRLFEKMINQKTIVVMTSNRVPEDLYKGGLQRHMFEPFIPFLRQKTQVVDMNSKIDYRYSDQEYHQQRLATYSHPLDEQNQQQIQQTFNKLSDHKEMKSLTLTPYEGRQIIVDKCANGVAKFTFDELCNKPYGSSDFIAITRNFHSIVLTHIPQITLEDRNLTRRFILFIDEIYNNKVKLYCSAQVDINNLFKINMDQDKNTDEYFALTRCTSRIVEMQSKKYMEEPSYYQVHNNTLQQI